MGIKNWFKPKSKTKTKAKTKKVVADSDSAPKERKPRTKKKAVHNTANDSAQPWVDVIKTHFDPESPGDGYFELDWNDAFIKRLVKAGYHGKSEEEIVEQWFQDICKQVVFENYEEVSSMQGTSFIQKKDIGNGKTEVK